MKQTPLMVFAGAASAALIACSGHVPSGEPGDAAPDNGRIHRVQPPREGTVSVTAFGAHEAGGVVAFDVASGRELARLALEGPIADLVWDGSRSRLLASVRDPVLDGARVVRLSWDGTALSVEQRSELFSGDVRVHADAASTLALSREMGTTWTLLDDSLGAVGLGKHLFTPSGLLGAGDQRRWLGLDASAFEDGDDADALVSVTLNRVWSSERWVLPAPGRPASLLVHAPGQDEAWLLRQWSGTTRVQLGEVLTVSPAVAGAVGHRAPQPRLPGGRRCVAVARCAGVARGGRRRAVAGRTPASRWRARRRVFGWQHRSLALAATQSDQRRRSRSGARRYQRRRARLPRARYLGAAGLGRARELPRRVRAPAPRAARSVNATWHWLVGPARDPGESLTRGNRSKR